MLRRKVLAGMMAAAALTCAAESRAANPVGIPDNDWAVISKLVDAGKVKWNAYDPKLGLKKDGSPYKVLYTPVFMGDDYQIVGEALLRTLLGQAGVKLTTLSADLNVANQVRIIQDAVATKAYDAIVVQPVNPMTVAGAIEKATAAGIDVYSWVTRPETDKYAGFVGYDATSKDTDGQVGAKFVQLATAAGATADKPYRALEIWGGRALPVDQTRHAGFVKGLDNNPIVQVVETADTMGNPETTIQAIEDAFNKHPDIAAIFPHWGDAGAFEEGLRSAGRLAKIGEKDHTVVILQDVDKAMLGKMRDGTFDFTLSNGPWQQIDPLVKMILWHTVLKQPLSAGAAKLPKDVHLPMKFLSGAEIDMPENRLFGASLAFTDMPLGKWAEWPVLDTSGVGLDIPTLDDRKKLAGY